MPRLFTALELPPETSAELARLRMPLPGAKWIDPANFHITLRFAGDIDARRARDFADNLAAIETDAFEVRLTGLGVFGGDHPLSVWAGVDASPALDALARAHEKAARNAGLAPEKRPFKPHVTLARFRNTRAEAVARYLTHYSGYRSEPFLISRVLLMSSRPSVGGGPYAIEDTFPVRGAGAWAGDDDGLSW